MRLAVLLSLVATLAAAGECVAIQGGWIRAADLRAKVPELEGVPPETHLWHAPSPGAIRQFRQTDWNSLGRRLSRTIAARDLCVAQRVRPVGLDEWVSVLAHAVSGVSGAAKPEILGVSHTLLPDGQIELAPSGLSRLSGNRYLWRGRLRHGSGYEVPVWVRFECVLWRDALVARRDLKTGETIAPEDVRVESRPGWLNEAASIAPSYAAGRSVRRPIRGGSEIAPSDLVSPLLVRPGESVRVSVTVNGTLLELAAVATQTGRLGDRVLMENPANRRRFVAIVTGEQAVSVAAGVKGGS